MKVKLICSISLFLLLLLVGPPQSLAIEKREQEEIKEQGYFFFPFPYSLPGIGEGILVTGLIGNILGTDADVMAVGIVGDASGVSLSISDINLIPDGLILGIDGTYLNHTVTNYYEKRGMDSEGEDYVLIELSKIQVIGTSLKVPLYDRLFELYGKYVQYSYNIPYIRDPDGVLITKVSDQFNYDHTSTYLGAIFNYTDHYEDPRKGIRIDVSRREENYDNPQQSVYHVWDILTSFYIPIGKINVLSFNILKSDARVTRKGVTDEASIRQELGFDCAQDDLVCQEAEQAIVGRFVGERTHGSAHAMGGEHHLRSYPEDRFAGAHSLFLGAEFRWNLTEEKRPFDYLFWKDIRTGFQAVFFYEMGSVSDIESEVGKTFRHSYGTGLRLVTASGYVYRGEIALGEEGSEFILFFNYPW